LTIDGYDTAASTYANITRADINTLFAITGNHKFNLQIPDKYKDGKSHSIIITAMDLDRTFNNNTNLKGIPSTFQLAAVQQTATSTNVVNQTAPTTNTGAQTFTPSSPVQITGPSAGATVSTTNPSVTWKYNNTTGTHYWVDVSSDPGFKWFWNKKYSISARSLVINSPSTWGKSGGAPASMPAQLEPGKTYYIRIVPFNGTTRLGQFTGSTSFKIFGGR
ncbi:MAG: hypothetical protein KDD94_11810, partial [Calditrichaeota bacterium]|nr:hypothetical protein [Calditrichota bacterium]